MRKSSTALLYYIDIDEIQEFLPFVITISSLSKVKISLFSFTCKDIDVAIVTVLSANHLKASDLNVRKTVVSANVIAANLKSWEKYGENRTVCLERILNCLRIRKILEEYLIYISIIILHMLAFKTKVNGETPVYRVVSYLDFFRSLASS